MTKTATKRFIRDLNFNKFERKNCISKICSMRSLFTVSYLLVVLAAIPSICQAQLETTSSGNILYVKIGNGMNAVLMKNETATNVELTMYVRAGSV
ncbi:MAG: hypothetical protein ACHP6H_07700, partial [Legionellales bacterium]